MIPIKLLPGALPGLRGWGVVEDPEVLGDRRRPGRGWSGGTGIEGIPGWEGARVGIAREERGGRGSMRGG